MGEMSRGGLTRGNHKACDHDLGWQEKYTPCGIVDEETGELRIMFGSSYKTSDFIVDALEARWAALDAQEQATTELVQIKMDNGPERSGIRTQFLYRMVQCADHIGKPVQLLYDPPYHSKYNPIERCWGILENHWNGSILDTLDTVCQFTASMTWKGVHPLVELVTTIYHTGVRLTKDAMDRIEAQITRQPGLEKWFIDITPSALWDV